MVRISKPFQWGPAGLAHAHHIAFLASSQAQCESYYRKSPWTKFWSATSMVCLRLSKLTPTQDIHSISISETIREPLLHKLIHGCRMYYVLQVSDEPRHPEHTKSSKLRREHLLHPLAPNETLVKPNLCLKKQAPLWTKPLPAGLAASFGVETWLFPNARCGRRPKWRLGIQP